MTFDEWFQSKQGEPYASMYMFARDAWNAAKANNDYLQTNESLRADNAVVKSELIEAAARIKALEVELEFWKERDDHNP